MNASKPFKTTFVCVMVGLPALALYHVGAVHHASLVLSHYFKGRAGNCNLAESFESESLSRLQAANFEEMRASSRVVRKDDHYTLWSTPLGDYWMPTASGESLAYDLAEQKRNIYGNRIHAGDVVLDAGRASASSHERRWRQAHRR